METERISFYTYFKNYISPKFFLILIFFFLTPLTILISTITLISLTGSVYLTNSDNKLTDLKTNYGASVFASLPSNYPTISSEIIPSDARPYIIKYYLESFNSPLSPYFQLLVDTADKYGLDYRLLTSIAMKESGLCKVIPEGTHNCWGWGIHKAGTLGFDSYPEAIEIVSKGLKEKYADIGLVTVDQIMTKYNATSPGGAWAVDVNSYMQGLR